MLRDVTRDEFYRALDGLKVDLKEDLLNIQRRVDDTNGRTMKNEIANENHRTRIVSLEKEFFRGAQPRRRTVDHAGEGEAWSLAFSKREGALMALGFTVIAVLLKVIGMLGEQLWHVIVKH